MQAAASSQAIVVSVDDVPEDEMEKERRIEMEKEDIQSKPEAIRCAGARSITCWRYLALYHTSQVALMAFQASQRPPVPAWLAWVGCSFAGPSAEGLWQPREHEVLLCAHHHLCQQLIV